MDPFLGTKEQPNGWFVEAVSYADSSDVVSMRVIVTASTHATLIENCEFQKY